MMNIRNSLTALAIFAASASAMAGPVTIDFEGTESFSSIADFYNGGAGTNYGISFSGGALSLANDELNPAAFANAPSPLNVMFATDDDAFLNAALGFTGAVSFYYSSAIESLHAVSIYSGLNGTGDVLGTFDLAANAKANCTGSDFCRFDSVSLAFAGLGKSIGFGSNAGTVAFDNVSITAAVPEPSTYATMGLGLLALGAFARRRQA